MTIILLSQPIRAIGHQGETVAPSLSWTALWNGASGLSDTSTRSLYRQHSQKDPVFHLPQVCGCLQQNRLYWRNQATVESGWKKRLWNPPFCVRSHIGPTYVFLNNPANTRWDTDMSAGKVARCTLYSGIYLIRVFIYFPLAWCDEFIKFFFLLVWNLFAYRKLCVSIIALASSATNRHQRNDHICPIPDE